MILNVLNQLGILGTTSVLEVRERINQMRQESNPPRILLNPNAWFTSEDVGKYLSTYAGLNVEEYVCFNDVQSNVSKAIQRSIAEQPYNVIYTTSGMHFTAIVNVDGQELFLDSLQNNPIVINEDRRNEEIRQNVFSNRTDVPDRVGIARAGREGHYQIVSL